MDAKTQELVTKAADGDKTAAGDLAIRFQGRILAIVRKRLGPKLRQRLESTDVAQEVTMDALRSVGNFKPQGENAFLAWLAGIIENRLRNEARTARRRVPIAGNQIQVEQLSGRSGLSQFEHSEEGKQNAKLLEKATAQLKADHRVAIQLRRDGQSFSEIGMTLSRSADAARMLHRRAIGELMMHVQQFRKESEDS